VNTKKRPQTTQTTQKPILANFNQLYRPPTAPPMPPPFAQSIRAPHAAGPSDSCPLMSISGSQFARVRLARSEILRHSASSAGKAFLHHFCTVSASLFAHCFSQQPLYQPLPISPPPSWCNSATPARWPPPSTLCPLRTFVPSFLCC
jgi:hypothetical protein